MLFMILLIKTPIITPGKTNNIGSQTGPNNTPNIVKLEEKINPTVAKNALNTYRRKEPESFPPPASFTVSHIAKKYKQG